MAFSKLDNPVCCAKASWPRSAEETSVTGLVEFNFDSGLLGSDAQHAAFDQADQQGGGGVETLRGGDRDGALFDR